MVINGRYVAMDSYSIENDWIVAYFNNKTNGRFYVYAIEYLGISGKGVKEDD